VRVLGGVLLVVSAGLVTSRNLFRHFIRRQEMVDVFIWPLR